ncbi:three component ABC system middle component [Bradyrhizobium sp. ORS 375]|uniref:three component ABC system middle component n=1 Tax=Bradyrhizobium sp. (strain ORS 375) TaxID=566679 RepID=UPI000556BB93|nr:three component ABC system middle component [Bradyrhizobium sp. ORS 375]
MKPWDQRPIEIRNLFNPAFCGLVLFRSFCGYEEEDARGMPFSLGLLILPLCLHKQSRNILLQGNRSYLLKVVSSHPELLVDFGRRATDVLPFTFEAMGFLMQLGALEVDPKGRLKAISGGVRKALTGTAETVACQRVARFLGKEFARVGDRSTIYTTLGVRP